MFQWAFARSRKRSIRKRSAAVSIVGAKDRRAVGARTCVAEALERRTLLSGVLSVHAIDASGAEPFDTIAFGFSHDGFPSGTSAPTVQFELDGTAAYGGTQADYTVSFVSGVGTFDTVTGLGTVTYTQTGTSVVRLTPINDSRFEPLESVTIFLRNSSGGDSPPAGFTWGDRDAEATLASDDPPPRVGVEAIDPDADEAGPDDATLTFTRGGGGLAEPLTITYRIPDPNPRQLGVANADDYLIEGTTTSGGFTTGSVSFAANQTAVSVTVTPLADGVIEGDETLTASIDDNPDVYAISAGSGSATVTIRDDPLAPPPPPRLDLVVDGLGETEEETGGIYLSTNDDFDEGNRDATGTPIGDNEADALAGHRLVATDDELRPGVLALSAGPTGGTWDLRYEFADEPNGAPAIKVWRRVGDTDEYVQVKPLDNVPAAPGVSTVELRIEGMAVSRAMLDVPIVATFTPAGGDAVPSDTAWLTVIKPDLDVDSDNDDGFGLPENNAEEYRLEDNPTQPGKYVLLNNNDGDGDGIPDFADGFNRDGIAGNADDGAAGEKFVPMLLSLHKPIDVANALVRFSYSASDPAGIVTANGTVTPAAGHLRVWTNDGNEARSAATVVAGGNYAAPLMAATAAAFGFSATNTRVVLYVEGIAADPAGHRIVVDLDPDGAAGPEGFVTYDAVRVTTVDSVLPSPTGLVAGVSGPDQVQLDWDDSPAAGVVGYRVYRGTTTGFVPSDDSRIRTSTISGYVDTGLTPGVYYYKVTAVAAAAESVPSAEVQADTRIVPAPVEVPDASDPGVPAPDPDEPPAVDPGAPPVDPDDPPLDPTNPPPYLPPPDPENAPPPAGDPVPEVPPLPTPEGEPPAAPLGLTAIGVSADRIDLDWSGVPTDVAGVTIERHRYGLPHTGFQHVARVEPGVSTYQDVGLEQGVGYAYRLRAYNREGYSPYSATAAAFTVLGAPTDLQVTFNKVYRTQSLSLSDDQQGVNLSWRDNAENELSYLLEVQQPNGTWANPAWMPANTEEWTLWWGRITEPQTIRVVAYSFLYQTATSSGAADLGYLRGYSAPSNAVTVAPLPSLPFDAPVSPRAGFVATVTTTASGTQATVAESDPAGVPVRVLVSRDPSWFGTVPPPAEPITVQFNRPAGTAGEGVDYQAVPRSLIVPADQSTNTFQFVPIDDSVGEWYSESADFSIKATEEYYSRNVNSYLVPKLLSQYMVNIVDDEPFVDIVDWQTYDPQDKPEGWTPNRALDGPADAAIPTAGGRGANGIVYRIFPEKKTPSDPFAEERRKVSISARVRNAREGDKVFFRVYDPDDPSADAPSAVDPTATQAGRETGGDNRGQGVMEILEVAVDAGGAAIATFTVAPQPGNNYRVFVSTDRRTLELLQDDELDGRVPLPNGVTASSLLTVWRTLHVERDSMQAPGGADGPFDGPGPGGNDDVSVDPDIKPADLKRMVAGYRPAYIVVADDLEKLEKKDDAEFLHNATTDDAALLANGVRDFRSSDEFWVVQTFAAYEPERDRDADRDVFDTQEPTTGIAPISIGAKPIEDGPAIIFVEVIRDLSLPEGGEDPRPGRVSEAVKRQLIVYHETVHRFQIYHNKPHGDVGILRGDGGMLEPDGMGGFKPYVVSLDDLTAGQLDIIRRESRPGRNDPLRRPV